MFNMESDKIFYLSHFERAESLDGPALAPPPHVVPNFENPPNNNPLAHAILAVNLVFSSLFLLIRAYSKIFCMKRVEVEDCELPKPSKSIECLGTLFN